MSEVKRYGHISYLVEATPQIVQLYPSMTIYTLASDFDAQRLRADTAEAEVARLEDEFDTLENTNTTIKLKLAAAEQRIAELQAKHNEQQLLAVVRLADLRDCEAYGDKLFHLLRCCLPFVRDRCKETEFGDASARTTLALVEEEFKRAALNPKPEAESHED